MEEKEDILMRDHEMQFKCLECSVYVWKILRKLTKLVYGTCRQQKTWLSQQGVILAIILKCME